MILRSDPSNGDVWDEGMLPPYGTFSLPSNASVCMDGMCLSLQEVKDILEDHDLCRLCGVD